VGLGRNRLKTVPRCQECGEIAVIGGPIMPSFDFVQRLELCAFGPLWSWCYPALRFSLWATPDTPLTDRNQDSQTYDAVGSRCSCRHPRATATS
jgi:hypothetical protein